MLPYLFKFFLVASFLQSKVQLIGGTENAKIDFDFWEVNKYFVKVIGALDKLTWYLQGHYHEGNLDLFIGTRIAEGQLITLLERAKEKDGSSGIISKPMIHRLELIRDRLTFVSERGAEFARVNEPQYFKKIGGILGPHIWDIDYAAIKLVNKSLITPSHAEEMFNEAQSDECVHHMLVSAWRDPKQCHVPEECWKIVHAPSFSGYSLTHQLFLLEIGAKIGCQNELQRLEAKQGGHTIGDEADRICANVYSQAMTIAHAGFPKGKHDIFMEQVALCGILGYANVFQSEWLDAILSWQQPNGCYGYPIDKKATTIGPLSARRTTVPAGSSMPVLSRAKRQDRPMEDGCSSHRTAVAAAALAAYVKFLALFTEANVL
ncbi:hypothetical protein RvY_19199 [Ramazzottius varieornatus]|uniref:Uncharacterized protein n=1 Tax=Ramazzottius varieornatus TaxID=947166 RepID=A0A1D1W8N3_RAMVA|nr:hypothetical protein RvY_19199 [Ramazzottius varieornatus]